MANRKKFSELNLNNAFLFAAAMEDAEICRLMLEMILGERIEEVQVKTEHSILFSSDYRCVRLDVFANADNVSYNVEMQNENEYNLPKRCRYHQAEMDLSSLKPGQDFNDLRPCVIIFICTFDTFGKGLYRYTYDTRCVETGDELGDEVKKIFLSTKGTNDDEVPQVLIQFLEYLENSTESYVEKIGSEQVRNLHKKIADLKKNRILEEKYMTMEELLKKEYNKGSERILKLTSAMIDDGRTEDISRLLSEPDFLEKMLKKYKL